MTKADKIAPYLLNLAGEYRVCSELCKRGVFATVTYGNRKGVDVYAISDRLERALKIEVKTTQAERFVTSVGQKGLAHDSTAPDFWVLFQLVPGLLGTFSERFFVLTHAEICALQADVNAAATAKYFAKHGKPFDLAKGVDNLPIAKVLPHEGQWQKIISRFEGGAAE